LPFCLVYTVLPVSVLFRYWYAVVRTSCLWLHGSFPVYRA